MFENLQDGLQSAFKSLRGKGKLTEGNMRDALRLVEETLLEADVSYPAVREFMDRVGAKALGEQVLLKLDPGQQVMAIVHQELIELLGPVDPSLHLRGEVTVLMMCGLQGSGKTTTCGKLAHLLLENKPPISAMLAAADLQRPAAIDQLHVLGEKLGVPVYSERDHKDPVKVCQNAVAQAKRQGTKVVILDTAGRLAIDEELMAELQRIDQKVAPHQVYLVVDGMTGQDAVNSAQAFNDALELDGVIMTKLDGDARGGALLSVKHVTGVPIKYIGTGEHLDSLQPFYPDAMADRILGGGDVRELIRVAQREIDADQQKEFERKMREGEITLEDFKKQLEMISKPGLMQKMISLMPGMGEINKLLQQEDAEGGVNQMIGVINSMTPAERRSPKVIDPSRRNRIATGAGVQVTVVNQLVKQFEQMKPLMQVMAGKGMGDRVKMMNELKNSGMLTPGAKGPKIKQGTGKRLSSGQRKSQKKQREKALKQARKKRKK